MRTKKKKLLGLTVREFYDENGNEIGRYSIENDGISLYGFGIESKAKNFGCRLPIDGIWITKKDFDELGVEGVLEHLRRWLDGNAEYVLKFIMKDLGVKA